MSRRGPAAGDPYAEYLGLRFGDVGVVSLEVRPELVNPLGKLLGPVAFALTDYAMGDAVWDTVGEDEASATVNIAINYLTSVDTGLVTCHAKVDRRGRALAYTSCEIRTAEGKVMTTAVGTFAFYQRQA